MSLFSNRVERSDIAEGDHIYSWRTLYAHHGIYIGNGLVIHFTPPPGKLTASNPFSSLSSSSSAPGRGQQRTCPNHPRCGSRKAGSGVAITCLDCFIEEGSLNRYEYGVTSSEPLLIRGGGGRTTKQSDPASTVVRRANYLFENGFGNYYLVWNNCEDFALYCKTGIFVAGVGRSGQVATYISACGIL
ncbi:hypothetical protein RHGRI_019871 [Rhododendron griersonianum]|uniref:LRAT domain-containing protein n=1 Tax=Rhododendron griersonianum TaxID=479676 RepID=A0AAV6JHD4_9ERIC|nr:hypothetical protein RHGRI_019871 [Rhododendron griersonianum]